VADSAFDFWRMTGGQRERGREGRREGRRKEGREGALTRVDVPLVEHDEEDDVVAEA